VTDGKVSLVAGVSKDLAGRLDAVELANFVAAQIGGKGGGRSDFAQAGGNRPEALEQALGGVVSWVEKRLT
jgi:alanyl-tRNA synthetase